MPHTPQIENTEPQIAEAVDSAATCSAFPRAKPANSTAGWTLDYATLEEIQSSAESVEGESISLDAIEIIILELAKRGFVTLTPNDNIQPHDGR